MNLPMPAAQESFGGKGEGFGRQGGKRERDSPGWFCLPSCNKLSCAASHASFEVTGHGAFRIGLNLSRVIGKKAPLHLCVPQPGRRGHQRFQRLSRPLQVGLWFRFANDVEMSKQPAGGDPQAMHRLCRRALPALPEQALMLAQELSPRPEEGCG